MSRHTGRQDDELPPRDGLTLERQPVLPHALLPPLSVAPLAPRPSLLLNSPGNLLLPERRCGKVVGLRTYQNPVYPEYFADPFVLRHDDRYYAYGTIAHPARTLPALVSSDLVGWEPLGDVLEPLSPPREVYWAPEVARADGVLHMY